MLFLTLPLQARPQVLVILADHLTLADVTQPGLPNFDALRQYGTLALMSPGLPVKPDPVANIYATLGAGDSIRVEDVSQGLMGKALRQAGLRTSLIGDADEYRTGPYRPAHYFLPAPDSIFEGGKREDPAHLWSVTRTALLRSDLVVVPFGDFAKNTQDKQSALSDLDLYLGKVIQNYRGNLLLIVPTPPQLPDGSWNSLTPFFYCRYPSQYQTGLRSDTTQTDGLIAARDIAPTILSALGVVQPLQMTGAAATSVDGDPQALRRLDRLTRINQEAQNVIFWTVGISACVIVFGGIGLYLNDLVEDIAGMFARYGLRLLASWTLALLFAPLADPLTVQAYLMDIAGLTALLAFLPSPALLFSLTAVVLVLDGLTGTHLVSSSALSEYALSGIRFYGIGNEYMGVLIGGALLATVKPFWIIKKTGPPASIIGSQNRRGGANIFWFALVTFTLSFPAFGAKAGGAVTATATFYIAWRLLTGQSVNWNHLLGSIIAGFALVFVWAILGHWLHLRRTHLETASDALAQGRFGYILGVTTRKIGLALRVILHPGTILGLMAFALIGVLGRRLFRRQVTEYLASNPRFAAVWLAGLWGCLVAVLFNDSGIVAAILILQCLVLTLLHGLYGEVFDATAGA